MTSRRAELIAGILSGVLGVAGLSMVLFGPVYQYTAYNTSSGTVHGSEGLIMSPDGLVLLPLPPDWRIPITMSLVLPLLILVSALLRSRQQRSPVGLVLLAGATVAFLIVVVFDPIQMIQLFQLPSLLLALVACVLAFRSGRQPDPVVTG